MLRFATHLHNFVAENVDSVDISKRVLDRAHGCPKMVIRACTRVQDVKKAILRHCWPTGAILSPYLRFCCPARKSSQIQYFSGFLKKWKITNFHLGWEWSQNELLIRSKVQNGSTESTETEYNVFVVFPAEFPAVNHDMYDSHIMIHGRKFGRDRYKMLIFGFCGLRRHILHLRTY